MEIRNKHIHSSSNTLEDLLKEISPERQKNTERKMLLAARIHDAMEEAGLKKGQLAKVLNKQPSEITRWLSGTHNFTAETLWEIGDALGVDLINITSQEPEQIVHQSYYKVSIKADPAECFEPLSTYAVGTGKSQNFIVSSKH